MAAVAVSVIIPVFNGAAHVGAAVASALAQQFHNFETIVIDDGSTDGTAEVLSSYGSSIRVLNQRNSGPAAARNFGCRIAQGRYLAFLDADDVWREDKLTRTIPPLEQNPDVVLVFSDATLVDDRGGVAADSYVTPDKAHPPSMEEMLTSWWPIVPSTAVVRRDAFERCGGFLEEFRNAAYEDPFLWLRMREQGAFYFVPERLAHYRTEPVVKRMEKYLAAERLFIERVQERYGAAADRLVRNTQKAYVTALAHEGLLAMAMGKRIEARLNFARALEYRPLRWRNRMRWARTFLPTRIARALSGKTAGRNRHHFGN